jgi:hypothetical protein
LMLTALSRRMLRGFPEKVYIKGISANTIWPERPGLPRRSNSRSAQQSVCQSRSSIKSVLPFNREHQRQVDSVAREFAQAGALWKPVTPAR